MIRKLGAAAAFGLYGLSHYQFGFLSTWVGGIVISAALALALSFNDRDFTAAEIGHGMLRIGSIGAIPYLGVAFIGMILGDEIDCNKKLSFVRPPHNDVKFYCYSAT